jgi:hypothetical protein
MKFTDRVYKALKFIALVALPAVGTLYFTLAGIWHFPDPEKVIGSITAVDTFLGLLLHISTKDVRQQRRQVRRYVRGGAESGRDSEPEALECRHERSEHEEPGHIQDPAGCDHSGS